MLYEKLLFGLLFVKIPQQSALASTSSSIAMVAIFTNTEISTMKVDTSGMFTTPIVTVTLIDIYSDNIEELQLNYLQ